MTSRINIYNKAGVKISEIEANTTRSWVISNFGKMTFDIATSDPKCTLDNLQFGNFILVEHDKLPLWGGIIDTPREWGDHVITVSAYTMEFFFEHWRQMFGDIHLSDTLNGLIGSVLFFSKKWGGDHRTVIGQTYETGKTLKENVGSISPLKLFRSFCTNDGAEFHIRPTTNTNGITFVLDVFEKMGYDTGFVLEEGSNIEATSRSFIEDGHILNSLVGSDDTNWSSRYTYYLSDEESISKYGTRFGHAKTDGITNDQSAVITATKTTLADRKEPSRTFDVMALDVGDTFNVLQLGNTVRLKMHSVGFGGIDEVIRIYGMRYTDMDNKVELILKKDES